MALNRDKIGTSYRPYHYEVSREKIREYARALGETDTRYTSDGSDAVAPPTFAAAFTLAQAVELALADPDLGAHTSLVHGSQRFAFGDRPIAPGDVLRCTPTITGISARGGNEFFTFEVDCRFVDDDTLAVRSQTMLVLLDLEQPAEQLATANGDPEGRA